MVKKNSWVKDVRLDLASMRFGFHGTVHVFVGSASLKYLINRSP